MVCKGKCTLYAYKHRIGYYPGVKRCAKCFIFLTYNGKFCPCCGGPLRSNPKDKRLKEKRRARKV